MKTNVKIEYFTASGEIVCIVCNDKITRMQMNSPGIWIAKNVEMSENDTFYFQICRDNDVVRKETRRHLFIPSSDINAIWKETDEDIVFSRYSFFFPQTSDPHSISENHDVMWSVDFGYIPPGYSPGIKTSSDNWSETELLSHVSNNVWICYPDTEKEFEYKFVLYDKQTENVIWETGGNRKHIVQADKKFCGIKELVHPHFDVKWRGAGVAVPVFSLRSETSLGIGDFDDLKKFIDWASSVGFKVVQVLPLNDTTDRKDSSDSYPYDAISSFALHPRYIGLKSTSVGSTEEYKDMCEAMNASPIVDYDKVIASKEYFLKKLYGEFDLKNSDYLNFVETNDYWLATYAAFSVMRDIHGTTDYDKWGDEAKFSSEKVKKIIKEHASEAGYYMFLQYLADRQLKEAAAHAETVGVMLKGDLPIGIGRYSADSWERPWLYNMDMSAGAPPDFFSKYGQNWGFPTYDWKKMEEDDFSWWKLRLAKMEEYFKAFRIDHILGFFRIWEIPAEFKGGLLGHFNPALPYSSDELKQMGFTLSRTLSENSLFIPDPRRKGFFHPAISGTGTSEYKDLDEKMQKKFDELHHDFFYARHEEMWRKTAMNRLSSLINCTSMIVCGEDLGMIPGCVPDVMKELSVLSLEIERMPKNYGEEMADTSKYPYLSVCSTGTHDTETLRGMWKYRTGTELYAHEAKTIIRRHLDSPSMLAIIPLQDYLAMSEELCYTGKAEDERINDPANPNHVWKYRMHVTIEKLQHSCAFNGMLSSMIAESGR